MSDKHDPNLENQKNYDARGAAPQSSCCEKCLGSYGFGKDNWGCIEKRCECHKKLLATTTIKEEWGELKPLLMAYDAGYVSRVGFYDFIRQNFIERSHIELAIDFLTFKEKGYPEPNKLVLKTLTDLRTALLNENEI